jgi:hypothetical protein
LTPVVLFGIFYAYHGHPESIMCRQPHFFLGASEEGGGPFTAAWVSLLPPVLQPPLPRVVKMEDDNESSNFDFG